FSSLITSLKGSDGNLPPLGACKLTGRDVLWTAGRRPKSDKDSVVPTVVFVILLVSTGYSAFTAIKSIENSKTKDGQHPLIGRSIIWTVDFKFLAKGWLS